MRSNKIHALLIVLALACPQSLWAWGEIGHKLIGAIAEEMMTDEGKAFVRGIIGIEPFAVSSVWPDEVRDDPRFGGRNELNDFSPYHFCEIPNGTNYETNPKKISKDCHAIIRYSEDLLRSKNYPRETKMITVRYLMHVIGDIHQPLHVGNGFDRGGNACKIKLQDPVTKETRTTNFHSFWDTGMVEFVASRLKKQNQASPRYYPEILAALKLKRANLFTEEAKLKYGNPAPDFRSWMNDAVQFRSRIYPDNPADMVGTPLNQEYKFRKYCNWYIDQNKDKDPAPGSLIEESKIPVIEHAYQEKFADDVEVQLIKAGLRVAAMFDRMARETQALELNRIDENAQKSIFQTIFDKLKNII